MIKKFTILALLFASVLGFVSQSFADLRVNGYYKSSGTYVQPHYRSSPDGNFYNNWSSRGNVNPYTGKRGYRTLPY
jgi:hypothetical protein